VLCVRDRLIAIEGLTILWAHVMMSRVLSTNHDVFEKIQVSSVRVCTCGNSDPQNYTLRTI
jgi:hypothetical protein